MFNGLIHPLSVKCAALSGESTSNLASQMSSESNITRYAWRWWYSQRKRPTNPIKVFAWHGIGSKTDISASFAMHEIKFHEPRRSVVTFERKLYKLNWKLQSRLDQHIFRWVFSLPRTMLIRQFQIGIFSFEKCAQHENIVYLCSSQCGPFPIEF